MSTKLHPVVHEFSLFKTKRLRSLEFVKVEVHQHDIESFEQLTFLEQQNVKCDTRAKDLILNTLEEEVVIFTLKLSSDCVMNAENHLILNYPKDLCLYDRLM